MTLSGWRSASRPRSVSRSRGFPSTCASRRASASPSARGTEATSRPIASRVPRTPPCTPRRRRARTGPPWWPSERESLPRRDERARLSVRQPFRPGSVDGGAVHPVEDVGARVALALAGGRVVELEAEIPEPRGPGAIGSDGRAGGGGRDGPRTPVGGDQVASHLPGPDAGEGVALEGAEDAALHEHVEGEGEAIRIDELGLPGEAGDGGADVGEVRP